jgi:hypothetical protein
MHHVPWCKFTLPKQKLMSAACGMAFLCGSDACHKITSHAEMVRRVRDGFCAWTGTMRCAGRAGTGGVQNNILPPRSQIARLYIYDFLSSFQTVSPEGNISLLLQFLFYSSHTRLNRELHVEVSPRGSLA